ncbi:uncharacterized protein LOC119559262 [Drosophila subpulchrella]|uniref:uncharacterized protein LOC119559262 n=1 Tax=Drosophila subpulchrella TaxID=1486046 RepID=UPI0018A18D45|nr:uncharacterized protein LOC119559262 [Drosophila subpulchrella]
MRQLKLNFASEKMSMIPTIAHLALMLCVLGCVAAYQQNCQPNGGYCQMHTDCCSRTCKTYNLVCAPRVDAFDPIKYTKMNIFDVMPVKPPKDKVIIYGLPGESEPSDDLFSFGPNTKSAAECRQVGQPCSRAEECCNMRCHTYLHRCVT